MASILQGQDLRMFIKRENKDGTLSFPEQSYPYVIGICRENPPEVLGQLYRTYAIGKYGRIERPTSATLPKSKELTISAFTGAGYPSLADLAANLQPFHLETPRTDEELEQAMYFLISRYFMITNITHGPIAMRLAPRQNVRVGPGQPYDPSPSEINLGPGPSAASKMVPIGLIQDVTTETFFYLDTRTTKKDPHLELVLEEILEIARITVGAKEASDLKEIYHRCHGEKFQAFLLRTHLTH